MAEVTMKINLPDGQETAIIAEFATALGWGGVTGTAGAYAKKELAGVIRETIKNYRIKNAVSTISQEKAVEVEALEIS